MTEQEFFGRDKPLKTPLEPRFTLTVEPTFLRIRWAPGITMYGRDIRSTIGAVDAVSLMGKQPLLVHIGSVNRITPLARQLLIDDTCSARTAVLGIDPIAMVITAFAYNSATLTKYFTSETEAIAWLQEAGHSDGGRV